MASKKEIPKSNVFEIESAQIHQPVGIGGILGNQKTINSTTSPGVKMSWTPMGLLVERKGRKALVPSANVAVVLLKD